MSFLSAGFAIFLGFGLVAFYLAPPRRRPQILLGLSLLFYATWSPAGLILLVAVSAFAYGGAILIARREDNRSKFRIVALSIIVLVVLLAGLKCTTSLIGMLQLQPGTGAVKRLVVPLGLSYYIFRTIGYLLDVYWERTQAQRSFSSLVLYISFFPQIVSGPIQRGGDFFGQLQHWSSPDAEQFASGLRRILLGLFRKVVIADQFAELVAGVHSNPAAFSAVELLFAAYCYSFQLYLDFSGLTDMAIGIGLLFGIKGPENFDRPFLSRNIQEFWRRWHMSLTSWLSDYLFFPLGMSLRRFGTLGLSVAIMINMVAVGVWHGPTWTYLDFGILNGLLMIGSVLTLKRRETFFKRHAWPAGVRSFFSTLITFHLVVFTQIWFRANSPQ